MNMNSDPFVRMIVHAFGGAILGMIGGLVLGLVIQYVSALLVPADFGEGPWQIASFLGMGFGSAIGAMLGGLVSMKK